MSILLVEDDATTAHAVRAAFSAAGFDVDSAESAEAALEKLNSRSYALMLLDVGLPGIDGFELLRRLRAARQNVPVLIMSGHHEAHERLRGFDLGADDYVVKPFLIDELRARARAVLRRAGGTDDAPYRHGSLEVDLQRRQVTAGGQPVELTRREWTVLEMFLRNRGRVIDKPRLAQACASSGEALTPNAVEVYVSRLRAKIEAAGGDFIRTVRGYGYIWNDQDA